MQVPDYYATLGVRREATAQEIKKAYRRLARRYHPDVSKEPDAAKRMAAINEAYQVLSDPEKRKVYDAVGHRAWARGARRVEDVRPPPGWEQGFEWAGPFRGGGRGGFEGAFSEFFEELFGQGARAQRGQARRGEDEHAEVTLDLAEAYRGTERTVRLRSLRLDAHGRLVPQARTLQVKVPAGVAQGQLIRLAGQGAPGTGGGPPGDLYLEVNIRTDARVRVSGRDVHMRVPVAPWEAALGATVTVSTPAGPLAVGIPPASTAGRKLRLKGKGIPGREPGDLYIELEVAVPSHATGSQRAAWEALARAYPDFDPRA